MANISKIKTLDGTVYAINDDNAIHKTGEYVAGTSTAHKDLNDYTIAGFYIIATKYVDNVPNGIGTYAVLLVYPWTDSSGDGTTFASQEITEAFNSDRCRKWVRKQNNGTWSEWVQLAFDKDVIHIIGNEEIDGIKTFKKDIYLKDTSPSIIARVTGTVKGTLPSSTINTTLGWYDGSGTTANSTRYSGISTTLYASGLTSTKLFAFKNEAGSSNYAELAVNYPLNESAYGTAPSTPQTGRSTDIITRDYLDYHKVEITKWSSTPIFTVTLDEALTATQSSPKQYGTTDFGEGYKELFIQLHTTSAQPTAAALRYRIIFTDDKSIIGQANSAISTSANAYTSIRVANEDGLAFTMCGTATGNPNRIAWYSLGGSTNYAPSFCSPTATIKTFSLWSITSAVTQLPAGLKITIWGRK